MPARPAGPVDPAAAVREVSAALPALEPLEVRALALVALADRPRPEVAELLGVEEEELGTLLAAARKELRQTLSPLSGSGWCERAEGLISERLDGVVGDTDGRRLDVHLRNCSRCVEHERRLVQATDALLAGIAPARPSAAPPTSDAPLTAVPPEGAGLEEAPPEELEHVALTEVAPAEPARAEPLPRAPSSAEIAAATEVLVTIRTRRQLAAAVTWNAMIAIAVLLTVASIALIVAGALGAHL
ncbi:MAG TPA: zf-HC2 domain-containing protein [Thermoleophilaceae bacterium]|nr:zf-HC2 domain-containing protein [Thermoleophilaceae bacterium]